ncbi:MAG: hypothetical protein QY303_04525 [Vicingaceae bacterium]|nr:MAG: hypothetical protein QY303_04525 [Vicingaceae bacterium]
MKTFDRNGTESEIIQLIGRPRNGRHASRPKKDLIFAPPHFLKRKKDKKELPPLNFLSWFLSSASSSTFASRAFLFVEKITNKSRTPFGKLAKELNPAHKTKTPAKKFCLPTRASLTALYLSTVLISIDCFSQTNQTTKPQFENFEPVKTGHYFTTLPNNNGTTYQTPQQNIPMGATAQDIINQTNSRVQGPVYTPNMTPQERQQANNRYIQQQMANDPAYQQPNKANNFSQTLNRKQQQEVADILNEVHSSENSRRFNMSYYKSPEFTAKTKSYSDALQNLKEQLEGKRKLSVSDAYFVMENAYGNSYLSKKEYDQIIKQSIDFIKQWLVQNGYSLKDNDALHLGIQKFLSDTLVVTMNNPDNPNIPKKTIHLPFFYDYEDFKGEKDFRNYFLTKCLATGSGQCNSMPAVYSSIADGLGAKSYLTFAPHHSFIKYPDNNGNIHSYEPTSNWKIGDKWYQDNMFISPKAKANGIYLDTLNKKQIVANCMIDLAFGYLQKHGAADGEFVKECIASAMQHFPKQNNIHAYFVYSSLLARQLDRILYENKITDLKDISKVPEAQNLYNALLKNEETITKLGYQDQPDPLYDELMKQHEFKGKAQQEKNISGKQKRDLFIKSF